MDLLSGNIRWLALAVAALGLVLGTTAVTLSPRRWWTWITNAVVIVLSSVMLMTSAFLVINLENGWYSRVNDIWTIPRNTVTTSGNPTRAAPRPSTTATLKQLPPLPSPGQTDQHFTVRTSLGSREWSVTVVLPDGYDDPANAHRTYPVLMLGSGFPGNPKQWLNVLSIKRLSHDLVKDGRLQPFVAVIPTLWPDGQDTECIVGPDDANQSEVWLSKDIPRALTRRLRIDSRGWAFMGISAGGYCAAMLTMRHPEQFAAAIMISGYVAPAWFNGGPPWGHRVDSSRDYDLRALARNGTPPRVSLWTSITQSEADIASQLKELGGVARPPLTVAVVVDDTGGHNFQTWQRKVPTALEWLAGAITNFATRPA